LGKIFISYRREVGHFVDRLAEKLEQRFSGNVFVDLSGIKEPDFESVILREISECDIFMLIVTPETFEAKRINKENDWIRREIALALKSSESAERPDKAKPIILIQVEKCPLPEDYLLPEDIRRITSKQGVPFYRKYFEAGIEEIALFCEKIKPEAFHRQPASYIHNDTNLEIRLKQSVREAINQLIKLLIKDIKLAGEEISEGIQFNAWTTAEGLLALLYTDDSMISSATDRIDQSILARISRKLVHIDEFINGGGIPAVPDLGIAHRGVVDSTSIVLRALCSLRLYMYQHRLSSLNLDYPFVSLAELDNCIDRLCKWLLQNQNEDGGWGLWRGTESRVTATAYAILAFTEAGVDREEQFLQNAQNWLMEMQKDDGWWALTKNTEKPDVTSTSFALVALSILCNSIMHENIRRAVYALETNTDWEDAEHKIEIPTEGKENTFVPMLYASEPRAVYALLIAGLSPANSLLLHMLGEIEEAELSTGGWTSKQTKSRKLNVWYTYVVTECIYTWFTHSNKISYLTQLSKVDHALAGVIKMYKEKEKEVQHLCHKIEGIKGILAQTEET